MVLDESLFRAWIFRALLEEGAHVTSVAWGSGLNCPFQLGFETATGVLTL